MLGIVYLLGTLGLLGTAKVVTGLRDEYEDSYNKNRHSTSWDQTYIDHRGYRRDCISGCRVSTRINEKGDEILYQIIGGDYSGKYKDLRNLSEIKRQMELKKNIEQAKKEGKTVAWKYTGETVGKLKGILYYINEPELDTVTKVPSYKRYGKTSVNEEKSKAENYINADRYHDIKTGEEYIICSIKAKKRKKPNENRKRWSDPWEIDDPNNETYFYMSACTGHIIRRTDNQIINDKNNTSNNCITEDSTNDFINKFNRMQDSQKEKMRYGQIEYNNEVCDIFIWDKDCFIKEKVKEKAKEIISI